MPYIDRFTTNQTLTRYRYQYEWINGTQQVRWTSVSVIDRATGKEIHKRRARLAIPQHVKNEVK